MIAPAIKPEFYAPGDLNYPEAKEFSHTLARKYSKMCIEEDIFFMDAGSIIEISEEDGAHFDEENHKKLSEAIWKKIRDIFSIY